MNLVESYVESGRQRIFIQSRDVTIQMLITRSNELDLRPTWNYYQYINPEVVHTRAPVMFIRKASVTTGRPRSLIGTPAGMPNHKILRALIVEAMNMISIWQTVHMQTYYLPQQKKILLRISARTLRGDPVKEEFLIH